MIQALIGGVQVAWREVTGLVGGLVGLIILSWISGSRRASLLYGALLGSLFFFFRDPQRRPDDPAPELILSPADGKVMSLSEVHEDKFFAGPAQRITIFLSLFNVHLQRAPYGGEVTYLHYESGGFAPAYHKDSDDNESNFLGLRTERGPLGIKQISGLVARRIVCHAKPGDMVTRAQQYGLIKFGSRVDLFLPLDVEVLVQEGDMVYGGQTAMARWPG